ncbi:hypothetical protein B0H10DRAFT_1966768 [Mycena sp. CBHHK59/15]|nr:hypothetical protein B0H10DRAFT_1966768 [Mycena sp. CBHHK59/15]
MFENSEHAECYRVLRYPESNIFVIQTHEVLCIVATQLRFNVLDLQAQGIKIKFSGGSPSKSKKPCNPIRSISQGKPVFNLRIMPWSDDVSVNVIKQYNAYMKVYLVNANIPHKKLLPEYFVRFCSMSPNASSGEQFDGISEDFKPGKYYPAYDCLLEQDILFRIDPHLLPAYNPQEAESSSRAGTKANYWSRYDKSGGSVAERQTDVGYHARFEIFAAYLGVQDAVSAIQTRPSVKDEMAVFWMEQLVEKARNLQQERINDPRTRRLRDKHPTGEAREDVKSEIKAKIQAELFDWVIMQPPERYAKLPTVLMSTATDLHPGDHFNVLLRLRGLDPHKDSPCEILRTYLIGVDKYVWHDPSNSKALDNKKCELFATRLQTPSIDGLTLPSTITL